MPATSLVDNLYSSVPLARRLLLFKIFMTGTCRGNSSGVPTLFAKCRVRGAPALLQPRGWLFGKSSPGLLTLLWRDSRPVPLVSAEPSFAMSDTTKVKRRLKTDRRARDRAVEKAGGLLDHHGAWVEEDEEAGVGEVLVEEDEDPDKPGPSSRIQRPRLRQTPKAKLRPAKRKLPAAEGKENNEDEPQPSANEASSSKTSSGKPCHSVNVPTHVAYVAYNACQFLSFLSLIVLKTAPVFELWVEWTPQTLGPVESVCNAATDDGLKSGSCVSSTFPSAMPR